MRQNGFTLMELITVVVILALVALVAFPAVNSTIKSSRESAYNSQTEILIKAAKEYFLDNIDKLPCNCGYSDTSCNKSNDRKVVVCSKGQTVSNTASVNVDTLVSDGYINEGEVINPKTNERLTGYVKVTYNPSDTNQYIYEYVDEINSVKDYIYSQLSAQEKKDLQDNNGVFKGSNPSNYATFANYTWRIIRVNSDGTLRMISNSSWYSSYNNAFNYFNSYLTAVANNSKTQMSTFCTGELLNECSETKKAKIGLLSTSEYIAASSNSSCQSDGTNCRTNNYLASLTTLTLNKNSSGQIYYINNSGSTGFSAYSSSTSLTVRPVITVKPNYYNYSRTGTSGSPFALY